MIDQDDQLHTVLRAATDHLRLPDSLARTARAGAARRVRRRRTVTAGLGVTAVAAAAVFVTTLRAPGPSDAPPVALTPGESGSAGAPTRCEHSILRTPADARTSVVTGGDRSGRYLLTRSIRGANRTKQSTVWDNGEGTPVPLSGEDAVLHDINGRGIAVGGSYVHDKLAAWVYRDRTVSRLAGDGVSALAINERNLVVGVRESADAVQRPLVWRDLGGAAEDLPLPAGAAGGKPTDVDDDSTIVGVVNLTVRDLGRGYVWSPDGRHRQLPMPTIDGIRAVAFWPTAIHDGIVDGIAGIDLNERERAMAPVLLDLRSNEFTVLARDIAGPVGNGRGWLAGDSAGSAVLIAGAERIVLTALAPPVPADPATTHRRLPRVTVLSDDARVIAGQATDASGATRAVVWRCR